MPLTNSVFSQPRTADYPSFPIDHWYVSEDEDKYEVIDSELIDLADTINDRLTRAEALSWVLYNAKNSPENACSVTAMIIAELIHEALEAHHEQWGKMRHLTKKA